MNSRLKFRLFESSWESWESLFQQASDFTNSIGREKVLNISHSCDKSKGTVAVWYWEEEYNFGQNFGINQTNFGE